MGAVLVNLHKLMGELQIQSCVNMTSQLQNARVLFCWKFLRQKMQMLLLVETISRQLQRVWGDKFWKKTIGHWKQKVDWKQSNFTKFCKTNQLVAKRPFHNHFFLIKSSNFRYQSSVAVSGYLGENVPLVDNVFSSREQERYPNTSLDENCIEFGFQTDRICYVDLRQTYFLLKLKFFEDRGYITYIAREVKKEHKEEAKADVETATAEEEQEVVNVNNILLSIFSIVEMYTNNQQIYNSNGLYAHKSYNSNHFKGPISEYKGVVNCEGYDYEEFPNDITEEPLTELFITKRMKLLSKPDGFMLNAKLGVDFFSTSDLLYPNMKIRLGLIRARPIFYMTSDNLSGSLGFVDCSFHFQCTAL